MTHSALPSNEQHDPDASRERAAVTPIDSLTGLRFLAAFAVFISHVRGHLNEWGTWLLVGGPAVSFFFVLSGFILTYVYDRRAEGLDPWRFWRARFARIWPLHAVCLALAVVLVAPPEFAWSFAPDALPSLLAQILLVHAWLPIRDWMHAFNAVSWSISTEAFFYLAFPSLLAWVRKSGVAVFLGSLAVAALVLGAGHQYWLSHRSTGFLHPETMALCHPLVRLPEFVLGILVCRWLGKQPGLLHGGQDRRRRPVFTAAECGCLLAIGGVLAWASQSGVAAVLDRELGPVAGAWLRVASGMVLFAITIVVFAFQGGLLSKLTGSAVFVWLGEISYAFYLVHQIVIRVMNESFLNGIPFVVVSFFISLLASALCYRLVEVPARKALVPAGLGPGRAPRRSGPRRFIASPGLHGALLVLAASSLWWLPAWTSTDQKVDAVIQNSLSHLRGVRFEGEATLLGATIERRQRGRFIRLVWDFDPAPSRKRTLMVIDAYENVIAQLPPRNARRLGIARANRPIVDEFWLPNSYLIGGRAVVTGFWSEEQGDAAAESKAGTANSATIHAGVWLELFPIRPRWSADERR